jgi:Kef-type K+ transport system membrane component KefB
METMTSAVFVLGLLLVSGLFAGMLAARLGIPQVVGYIFAGILFSQDLLGAYLNISINDWSEPITTAALGLIAYLIGGSMTMNQLRRMGKVILGTTLGQSLGAIVFVLFAMLLLSSGLPGITLFQVSLIFAVLAASTAPAATVAVLHEYRARGILTTTILGTVALDDALAIIVFSLVMVYLDDGSSTAHFTSALIEIGGAIVLGAVLGYGLARIGRLIHNRNLRLPLVLGTILLVVGIADKWHLSPLLAAMIMGFVTRLGMKTTGARLFQPIENIETVIFIIFFTLAGAHFESSVFSQYLDIIFIYFFARIVGKMLGAALAAKLCGAPQKIVKYLGFGLLPQAGVAVGLALVLSHSPAFHDVGPIIVNVVLAATLLNELFGSIAVRYALVKSGEIGTKRGRSV